MHKHTGDRPTSTSTALGVVILAIVYTTVGRLGLNIEAVGGFATVVWPSTGLALASLLVFGSRLWPGIFIGATLVNLWAGAPVYVAVAIAAGNSLEALLGAFLMRRVADYRGCFDRIRHVIGLIVCAAIVATLVSTTIGITSLTLARLLRWPDEVLEAASAWWLGDAVGNLVVAPLLLSWATTPLPKPTAPRVIEAAILSCLLTLASYRAFMRPSGAGLPFEFAYIVFPLLVWAALRFEMRGATLATAVTSTLALWGTLRGEGPFLHPTLAQSLFSVQTFMAFAALTPLVVAGATMERARAVSERENILAAVSHDLKNPLNSVLVSSELLVQKLPDELVVKHHKLVRRSIDRMMHLIRDLLDASAIERGRLAVERRREDLRVLVGEAVDLLRPLAPDKKLLLDAPAEPLEFMCDRERVLQVLTNVIGNALKFSPELSCVRVKLEAIPHAACVSIQDEGPGIEASELCHIFDRHWHTQAAGGGSGLGLFIAKGIVDAHGGRIWAESKPGAGSTFYFTIPAQEELRRARVSRVASLNAALERIRTVARALAPGHGR